MKKFFFLFAAILIFQAAFSQKGIIRGSIIEESNGEAMFGVTVVIKGTTNGAITDFDGKFEIKAEAGTYDLQVSFISYSTVSITGVTVASDEVTIVDNIRMSEDVKQLEEVIVTAEVLKNSEEAILTLKRKSASVIDGISAANFRKIGDSDAASAMKRVTGVSVEGGKYIYVRGLGDRYTKTVLNDVDIPGLDPDRNSLQMDIFPTNVIDNIVVSKSFTAESPADFTGGIVNIETKEFPESKNSKIGLSLGYNPSMHFNSEYLKYEGGSTDFLGFDDGTRAIPWERSDAANVPLQVDALRSDEKAAEYQNMLSSFNPTLAAQTQQSFMNFSVGYSTGNQFAKDYGTLGYNFALTYKNTSEFYKDIQYSRWGLNQDDNTDTELDQRENQVGNVGSNNVLIGGMAGFAVKTQQSKYRVNLLHLQNGETKSGVFNYVGSDQGSNFEGLQHNLEYSQRMLTNVLLNGTHYSDDARWMIDWKLSPTSSIMNDPDIRFTRYRTDDGSLSIGTESGIPARIWRYLDEQDVVGKVDLTRELLVAGNESKLRFGASNTYKQRNYEILSFQILPPRIPLTGDPDELFQPENLWTSDDSNGSIGRDGLRAEAEFQKDNPNSYDANINVIGTYASLEFNPAPKLKTIAGLRAEQYTQRYTGSNQTGSRVLDNDKVLDDLDLFPTLNLIYSITEKQNLRASFSRTIARPSFKEASFAEIFDPLTGRTFIGSLFEDRDPTTGEVIWDGNIQATRINNFDLRWEIFFKKGQTVSFSGFYKTFDAPIEIVQFATATGSFQPRNVGDGEVYGLEFEWRQNLGIINEKIDKFSINGNVTYTFSQIKMNPIEYNSRVTNARDGQDVKNTRQMAGQAPYVMNGGISYNNENGFEAGFFYNVQGPTLLFVGIVDRPDIYSVPFHSLNFNSNKSFGQDDRFNVGFKVSNILGDKNEQLFRAFEGADQYFTRINPGREFSASLSYKFF